MMSSGDKACRRAVVKGKTAEEARNPMCALSGCALNKRMTVIELLDGALPQNILFCSKSSIRATDDNISSVFILLL